MMATDVTSGVASAMSTASALGLRADDAMILQNSNRLTMRLLPCDILARVAPVRHREGTAFELEVAHRLAGTDAPIAELEPRVEPRVHFQDGFAVTLWRYYQPVVSADVTPREYALALERLHAGMRQIDLPAPHFTDRVAEAQRIVDSPPDSPALADADRELLSTTLREVTRAILGRGAAEQLLHGEPHLGNLLRTEQGLLFTDFETCCRGPIEFDIADCARIDFGEQGIASYVDADTPFDVAEHYEHADPELVRACWTLMLAMVAAWRADRRDDFPDGQRMLAVLLNELRRAR